MTVKRDVLSMARQLHISPPAHVVVGKAYTMLGERKVLVLYIGRVLKSSGCRSCVAIFSTVFLGRSVHLVELSFSRTTRKVFC